MCDRIGPMMWCQTTKKWHKNSTTIHWLNRTIYILCDHLFLYVCSCLPAQKWFSQPQKCYNIYQVDHFHITKGSTKLNASAEFSNPCLPLTTHACAWGNLSCTDRLTDTQVLLTLYQVLIDSLTFGWVTWHHCGVCWCWWCIKYDSPSHDL